MKNLKFLSKISYVCLILGLSSPFLYSQCEFVTTGQWTSPQQESFQASMGPVVTTITVGTIGKASVRNVLTTESLTTDDPSWFSLPVAGNPSLQMRLQWDVDQDPNPLADIDDPNDDKATNLFTINFSQPVICPILHIERLGGFGRATPQDSFGVSNSLEFTILTPGVTMVQPPGSGSSDFIVTPTTVSKLKDITIQTAGGGVSTELASTGSAAGSVKLSTSTPVTTLDFEWTGVGVEGLGGETFEIAVSAIPSCFPMPELEKRVTDIRSFTGGDFLVDFNFLLSNTGDVPLENISLIDSLSSNLGCSFGGVFGQPTVSAQNISGLSVIPNLNPVFDGLNIVVVFTGTDGALEPGDFLEVMLTAIVDPECLGPTDTLCNHAILIGENEIGAALFDFSDDPNDPTNVDPDDNGNPDDPTKFNLSRIGLEKKADLSQLSNPIQAGDVILYDFTVCNIGSDLLSNIVVSDNSPGVALTGSLSQLAPGECDSTSYQASYSIQTADLIAGMFSNQATVRATSSSGFEVNDLSDDPCDDTNIDIEGDGEPDDRTIVSLEPVPNISIVKTSQVQFSGAAAPGDLITYQFTVCNTGALPLNSINVDDPLVSVSGGAVSLNSNECNTTSFTGNYVINQEDIDLGVVSNSAMAIGTDPNGNSVADTSTINTNLFQSPSLQLFKSDNLNSISNPSSVGDVIVYSFEVCNNGNVTIDNIFISDNLVNVRHGNLALLPGECKMDTIIGEYTITIDDIRNLKVTNSATVTGTDPNGINISDVSDDSDGILPGENDPTISTLFECQLSLGSYMQIPNACIDSLPISIDINQTTAGQIPPQFNLLYMLVDIDSGIILQTSTIPQLTISNAGSYGIYALIANSTLPGSGNYFDPSFVINGVTSLDDIDTKTTLDAICARQFLVQDILVSQQPEINFREQIRICNSTQLGMVDAIDLDTLLLDSLDGIWQLSPNTPMNPLANTTVPDGGSGLIDGSQFQFTNIVPGIYTFLFESTSAVNPCLNVSDSISVEVVDCFAECEELVCISDVRVSLNDECMLVLEPDDLLENPVVGLYTIELFFEDGDSYASDTLTEETVNFRFTFNVGCLDNTCWGSLKVSSNNHPDFNPICPCNDDSVINDQCKLWCVGESELPASIISTDEVLEAYEACGPELLSDVIVEESIVGDICDPNGVVHELKYSVKVKNEELIETVEILCQRFVEYKIDIDVDSFDFNSKFGFPEDITLDCGYIDELDEEDKAYPFASPHSIQSFTNTVESAFPYIINRHELIDDSIAIPDTHIVQSGQILVDSMVYNDFDNDGIDEWELITVVKKTFDTLVSDSLIPTGLVVHPRIAIDKKVCNVLSTYSDVAFDACGEGTKILRHWSIIDFCDDRIEKTDIQVIEIIDLNPPVVYKEIDGQQVPIFELEPLLTGVEPWSCNGIIPLPKLKVKDNCDPDPKVIWSIDEGRVEDGYITDIWLGQEPIKAHAKVIDHCLNSVTLNMQINVIDDVAPVVVADKELTVSLAYGIPDTDGTAKIFAKELDEGSHDSGCGEVILKVVRMDDWSVRVQDCTEASIGFEATSCEPSTTAVDIGNRDKGGCVFDSTNILQVVTEPADFVKFCCNDVGQTIPVLFFVYDESGNRNQTKVNILVRDESVPTLICDDIFVDCADEEERELIEDLDNLFAVEPFIEGGACPGNEVELEIASVENFSGPCGSDTIVVEWFLDVDLTGDPTFGDPMCTQEIVIDLDGRTLDPYDIKWPPHYTGELYWAQQLECDSTGSVISREVEISLPEPLSCSPDLSNDIGPVWCDSQCGIIGVSSEMDTIFTNDACMKVIKSWTIVDWCVWTANSDTIGIGMDSLVLIKDNTIKECSTCALSGPFNLENQYFRYSSIQQDGYYTFDQIIKVVDDTPPQLSIADTILVSIVNGAESKDDKSICTGEGYVIASATDICGGTQTSNDLTWRVSVRNSDGELLSNNVINEPGVAPSVTITNTLQSVEFDVEEETVIDGPESASIGSDLEFSQFAGLYDINVQNGRIDFIFNPSEERFPFDTPRVIEEGSFDRYYFSFENINIEDVLIDDNASLLPQVELLSETELVVTIGEGMEIGPGFDAVIFIESTISQTVSVHTGAGRIDDQHTIEWSVSDDCGNETTLISTVLFVDDIKPTPVCLTDVTTVNMGVTGIVTIPARNFDFSSFDNCTLAEDLVITAVRSGERPIFPAEDGFYSQVDIELSCLDLAADSQLDIWVWDASGNGEFCRVRLNISDQNNDCENFQEQSQGLIEGTVSLANGVPMSDVNVNIEAALAEYPKRQLSDEAGKYRFNANPSDANYQIHADKSGEFSNGLSTLDLVHIQRHIIGLAEFENPYKIIAADANSDASVSVSDIVALRKIVLGVDEYIGDQEPWLFVTAEQDFIDIQNPWPYIQQVFIQNFNGEARYENIYGIKIGDVNDDVALSNLEIEKRTSNQLEFTLEDKLVGKGEIVTIPLKTSGETTLYGLQFTLMHDNLNFLNFSEGVFDIQESNFAHFGNQLTFSFNNEFALIANKALFELRFEALEAGLLSSFLEMNSAITIAQAYSDLSLNYMDPTMDFINSHNDLKVMPNVPNPFVEETRIGFVLGKSSDIEMTIYDTTGKIHFQDNSFYPSGHHEFRIDKNELSKGGIYYYTLKTDKEKVVSRMILIDR